MPVLGVPMHQTVRNIAIVEKNERYGLINIEKREEIIPLGLKGKEFLEKLREFPN